MGDNSQIQWTDATWNPIAGCSRVSAGCDHCYAIRDAARLAGNPNPKIGPVYAGLTRLKVFESGAGARPDWSGVVRCLPERLEIPLGWKRPRRIFVNSMSDLFHPAVPFEFIDQVFAVMAVTPQHTYQVLTKRPERLYEWATRHAFASKPTVRCLEFEMVGPRKGLTVVMDSNDAIYGWPLPNVWLGTSVENQDAANERIPWLMETPAAVRFLSCEPLLGAVDLRKLTTGWTPPGTSSYFAREVYPLDGIMAIPDCDIDSGKVHWVIAGGESGLGSRPVHLNWVRWLRDQCQQTRVPFFFKQWGAWLPATMQAAPDGRLQAHFQDGGTDNHPQRGQADHWWSGDCRVGALSAYVGKKVAGRLLDGREWNEFPVQAALL